MVFSRDNIKYLIAFVFIGLIFGWHVGKLLSKVLPAVSVISYNFTHGLQVDLGVFFWEINLTPSAVFFAVLSVLIFRKV